MTKRKNKSKPKSKQKPWITITGRFPSESEFAAEVEAKSHYPPLKDEPIWDPAFPTKKMPYKQALIDIYQTVRKLNNLEEFAQALEDVLPFWIKHSTISAILQQQVALAIQQRGAELRAKYDGDPVPPAIPNTILGQRDWLTDYKRCSQMKAKKVFDEKSAERRWSKIMSKQEIATGLGLVSVYKLNTMIREGTYEINSAGNRQSWQIRIDKLDDSLQQKFKP